MAAQKLEAEPRLTSVATDVLEWARRVARAVNGTLDDNAAEGMLIAQAAPPGQFSQFMLTAAPAGWIAGDGSTIGNVGSGASRANVDTLALFTVWWSQFSDAQLPILTSAGGASTRGASAAADWAALKRLTVFDVRSRFPRNANGSSVAVGANYADAFQGHFHDIQSGIATAFGPAYTGIVVGAYIATEAMASRGTIAVAPTGDGVNGAPRIAAETRPVNFGVLGCFKL